MSKDPAFLFYSSDFLTGTMFMNNEQVGKYIRLLCAQHQRGHLSNEDMLFICGSHDAQIWSKFEVDNTGLYFNRRCEEEIFKRKAYCKTRSDNRKSKKDKINISKTHVKHVENENEDINDNNNKIDIFINNELKKDFDSEIKEQYRLMWDMIKDVDAKHLITIPKPLTLEQYAKLRVGRTASEVNDVIKSMMNAPGHFRGSKAKVSFYLTANDWLKIRTKPIKS